MIFGVDCVQEVCAGSLKGDARSGRERVMGRGREM